MRSKKQQWYDRCCQYGSGLGNWDETKHGIRCETKNEIRCETKYEARGVAHVQNTCGITFAENLRAIAEHVRHATNYAYIQNTVAQLQNVCALVQTPCCNTVHIVGPETQHTNTKGSTQTRITTT